MTNKEVISHIRDILAENNSIKPSMVVFELEKEALRVAIEALEQTRWIPVSERLPEENEFVIVTIETVTISKGKERSVTKCMYSKNSIFWKEYVVAWMPYPEPYKEEKE